MGMIRPSSSGIKTKTTDWELMNLSTMSTNMFTAHKISIEIVASSQKKSTNMKVKNRTQVRMPTKVTIPKMIIPTFVNDIF